LTKQRRRQSHARWPTFTGADIEEGIDAFFAKRAPVFTAGRSGTLEYKRNETEAGALSPRSDKDDKLYPKEHH
jgi:hypothetical protein